MPEVQAAELGHTIARRGPAAHKKKEGYEMSFGSYFQRFEIDEENGPDEKRASPSKRNGRTGEERPGSALGSAYKSSIRNFAEGEMMDAELRDRLTQFAETTLRDLRVAGSKVTLEMMLRKTQLPVAKNARILAPKDVRRRLMNARLWQGSTEEICAEWITGLLIGILRKERLAAGKAEMSAARERQLALFPGFETLPIRIRSGSGYVKFPETTVSQFLAYESKYQARTTRNQRTAEELHRLAGKVQRFAEANPDLSMAEAFGRSAVETIKLSVATK